ncbi:MAG: flippase [Patescibacteria group bacterium]
MPSLKQRVLYNTFIQFVGRFGTSFLGFVTTVIIARYLGAAGYGVYAKAYALVAFFYLFVDFGLNAVYIRKYKEDLSHYSTLNALRTMFFLMSVLVIGAFLLFTRQTFFQHSEKLIVVLFVPSILFFGYFTSINLLFQLLLRYDLSVIAALVGSAGGLLSMLVAMPFGLPMMVLSLVGGSLLTVVVGYLLARKYLDVHFFKEPFLIEELWLLMKEAAPVGLMLFLNTMYFRADVFVLSALKTNADIGVYQLAYKFFEFPLAFATFFANAIFPHYVKLYQDNRERFTSVFTKAMALLLVASLVFTVGTYFIAPFLVLIKSDYHASIVPLQILGLSYPIFFVTSALTWLLFLQKKEMLLVWVYLVGFVINVIGNLYFIPRYSYLASTWMTIVGEGLILVMLGGILIANSKLKSTNNKSSLNDK